MFGVLMLTSKILMEAVPNVQMCIRDRCDTDRSRARGDRGSSAPRHRAARRIVALRSFGGGAFCFFERCV